MNSVYRLEIHSFEEWGYDGVFRSQMGMVETKELIMKNGRKARRANMSQIKIEKPSEEKIIIVSVKFSP